MCDEVGMESELPVEAYIACIAEMDTTITHILEANAMQRQIQWKGKRWYATTDGGTTWTALRANDYDYSPGAISEACDRFGGNSCEWDIADDAECSPGEHTEAK